MHIILGILFVIVVIIFIIFSIFRRVLSFVFGGFKSQSGQQNGNRGGANNSHTAESEDKKVFQKEEGEYVHFEEVE